MEADEDGDGKLSFDEFARTVANTVCDYVLFFWYLDRGTCHCQKVMLACIVVCVFPYSIFITDVSRIPTYSTSQDIVKQMTLEDLF